MSYDYNYKFWVATQKELEDIMKRQDVLGLLKPVEDRAVQHLLFAELYARYVNLVNKLGYIYDNTFQVQKRPIVKNLVEAATSRLLELKNELKNIEFCEFIYIDKTLIERRLTPDEIIVFTPKYFPYWRPINIHELIHGPRKKVEDYTPTTSAQQKGKDPAATGDKAAGDKAAAGAGGGISQTVETRKSTATITRKQSVVRGVGVSKADVKVSPSLKKGAAEEAEAAINLEKKQFKDAVTLIQSHERARVARRLFKHIKRDPDHYRPKMREDSRTVIYIFTHKPNQSMLIPIKRTQFEANYFITRTDLRMFQYYVKPIFYEETTLRADLSDLEESDLGEEEALEEISGPEEEESEGSEMSEYETESITAMALEEMEKKLKNEAATKIQAYWRGSRQRKIYKELVEQKAKIYGMTDEFRPTRLKSKHIFEDRMKEAMKNRLRKEKYDEELVKFCEDERARILRVRGPWIMEDISDGIRAWFKEFYDKTESFHPYPDEAKGGTLLLLKGETMDVYEFAAKKNLPKMSKEEKKRIKDKEREKKKKEKEKARKIKKAIAKRRAKLKKAGIVDFNDEMSLSKPIKTIEDTIAKYKKEWADIDEKLNENEDIIKEWVTSDYFAEIHQELQGTVDELMRLEYELLQRALAKDLKKKYKAPKKKKPKKPKKKKTKKEPHDPTADRSVESLYYELQDNKIAKLFPQKTYDDYLGDRNFCAYHFLNVLWKYTPPCAGEIKDVLQEYVLGMGPLEIHKPKAILLAGPTHCGKRMLCNILASEIDAVVLDISPENIIIYHENMSDFCHLIVKMARLLQPTIIFIRDIHRVFWKKVPKDDQEYNPKILQKWLKKHILKPLKKHDRVFLLGTTDTPWSASGKMKSLFQKILLIPKTEYATSFILRRTATLQNYGVPRTFPMLPLSLVTRDYATGDLIQNINGTLNLKRKMILAEHPIQQMEFLDNLLNKEPPLLPPDPKIWDKFTKWFKKVSKMEKKRVKMMKDRADLMEKANKKKKK